MSRKFLSRALIAVLRCIINRFLLCFHVVTPTSFKSLLEALLSLFRILIELLLFSFIKSVSFILLKCYVVNLHIWLAAVDRCFLFLREIYRFFFDWGLIFDSGGVHRVLKHFYCLNFLENIVGGALLEFYF